jgi:D-3-phosphoglycerate dehydrogenase
MATYRVLLSDALAEQGLQTLRSHPELEVEVRPGLDPRQLARVIPPYHALVIRSATKVTREVIEAGQNLRVIGRAGVGVDNVDLDAATRRGVVVMNSPSGNAVTTAEHTIAMLMALARHIPAADRALRSGRWERAEFTGVEICNKVLGVIGLGNIGRIVADRALGLKMRVIGVDPIVTQEAAGRLGVELVTLEELFGRADFITVHTPLSRQTQGLIGAAAFARMKPGVRLINCARGGIVDEQELAQALCDGRVAGAALDVFAREPLPADHPLLAAPNLVVTPHLGAATGEAQTQVAVDIAQQVADYLLRGIVRHAVNLPALSPKELEAIQPHLRLAEKLGHLAAQLIKGAPEQVSIGFGGEAANVNPEPIVAAALKGLLSRFLDQELNYVNAPFIARERGIKVIESRSREATDYVDNLTLEARGAGGALRVVGAVVGGRGLRLIGIDGFRFEAVPEGHFLVLHNRDVPGVVGAIGTVLGSAGINIAGLDLGRDRVGGMAISLVSVDEPVSPEVIERLNTIPAITSAATISL